MIRMNLVEKFNLQAFPHLVIILLEFNFPLRPENMNFKAILLKPSNIKVFAHLFKRKWKLLEKCLNIIKKKLINFLNHRQANSKSNIDSINSKTFLLRCRIQPL